MPQMMPLLWILILFTCMILFLLISMMIYFFSIYSIKNHMALTLTPLTSYSPKWTWKW